MKKTMLWCALSAGLLAGVQVDAQSVNSNKVPASVKEALHKKYPAASHVTWEREDGNFEANWGGRSGEDISVQFTPAGIFVEQVKAISVTQLPPPVISYIKAHYKGARINDAGRMTDAKGITFYEAEVRGRDMLFDGDGKFVRKE